MEGGGGNHRAQPHALRVALFVGMISRLRYGEAIPDDVLLQPLRDRVPSSRGRRLEVYPEVVTPSLNQPPKSTLKTKTKGGCSPASEIMQAILFAWRLYVTYVRSTCFVAFSTVSASSKLKQQVLSPFSGCVKTRRIKIKRRR